MGLARSLHNQSSVIRGLWVLYHGTCISLASNWRCTASFIRGHAFEVQATYLPMIHVQPPRASSVTNTYTWPAGLIVKHARSFRSCVAESSFLCLVLFHVLCEKQLGL